MTPDEEDIVRGRQKGRALIMALLLGALVILVFAITFAKIKAEMSMSRTGRTATLAVLFVCFMTGLAWASVPLYRLFCQATGLNGTTGRGIAAPGAVDHKIEIDFDTNVAPNLSWTFKPEARSDTVDVGARDMAFFTATNNSKAPVTGTATFNVQPAQAGRYFKKIQCFCFTQQTLKPGETARMPVIFYVDPGILKDPDAADIQTITLSYTFYPSDAVKAPAGRTAEAG